MLNFDKTDLPTLDNPFIVIPDNLELNQLTIPKNRFCFIVSIVLPSIIVGTAIILLALFKLGIIIPIAIVGVFTPFLLGFLCCTSKMELIKDKANNILTLQEKNMYRCKKKRYTFPLDSSVLQANYKNYQNTFCCRYEYSDIYLFNVDPKVKDIDNNNIKNVPFKFFTKFEDYIGEEKDLNAKFSSFIGNKFENNIEEEINLYSPNINTKARFKYSRYRRANILNIFVKISDHFYMFYNHEYLEKNYSNESFKRLDWIYTNDFDRIFIGVVGNDETYVNTFVFNINTIDKFILEVRFGQLCLKIMLKDRQNIEICRYTTNKEKELDTFIYLINGQINKINNKNNQDYPEKPEEPDNSAPTLM